MKERITRIVSPETARYLWMGTFHSIFAKILRMEGEKLGYKPNFTIYDTSDSRSLIRTVIREMNLDDNIYKPGVIGSRISAAKNNLVTAGMYAVDAQCRNMTDQAGCLCFRMFTRHMPHVVSRQMQWTLMISY